MVLPIDSQQCFFVVILAFIVIGFVRGWRRELVSLVFILLAVFLVRPDTSRTFAQFLSRLPTTFGYLIGNPNAAPAISASPGALTPFWSLVIFIGVVLLGYYIGNRAFPKPGVPQERFIGIVPAIVSGAFVMGYLSNYLTSQSGQPRMVVAVPAPDPVSYVPLLLIIAILAVVIGLIAARAKKAPAKK